MDKGLQDIFKKAVTDSSKAASAEVIESVHAILVQTVYNARCNEFLRTISKLACIAKEKVVDGNVSLRDELKVYAIKKLSS